MSVRIGIHVSISGSLAKAIERARIRECQTIQIFARTPRAWKAKPWDVSDVESFKQERRKSGIRPVVIHTCYLLNLASPDADLRSKSIEALVDDLQRADMGGIEYVVTHPGSSSGPGGVDRVRSACLQAMDAIKSKAQILVENVSGGGGKVGGSFEELAQMVDGTRFGVCLDTCHAFAAGYPIHLQPGRVLDEFDDKVGMSKLKVLHLNDSVGEFGSHVDHHQHIGKGFIGLDGFERILAEPRIRAVPGILETPQRATDDPSDDLANVRTVRRILQDLEKGG